MILQNPMEFLSCVLLSAQSLLDIVSLERPLDKFCRAAVYEEKRNYIICCAKQPSMDFVTDYDVDNTKKKTAWCLSFMCSDR